MDAHRFNSAAKSVVLGIGTHQAALIGANVQTVEGRLRKTRRRFAARHSLSVEGEGEGAITSEMGNGAVDAGADFGGRDAGGLLCHPN